MTILVTGGTGLVGSRLIQRLVDAGVECRVLVRPGRPAPAGATAVQGDILDPGTLEAAVDGVTAIIHLAAVLRTPDPDEILQVNLEGTRNLIDATCAHAPHARLVMASTGLVYSEVDRPRPAREDDVADSAQPYPASKIAAEELLRESGLTWSVLRFGFVYGDGDGHLEQLPRLAAMLNWHPARAVSLIHHRDIAGHVDLALAGAFDNRIVNVTDDAPTTVYELAALVGAPIETTDEPLRNPWAGRLDGTLARKLGFTTRLPTVHQAVLENAI
ncbi:NAD(P)-dependent oxidoreductase [Rhodococcus sp. B10]|uniref:NAD-dependent epimerase/dehydratase family protein n=1 Tax=Rhodococcus sp. B10 TaxID=2695876 RepID=UPI001430C31F|nr:NAD(P)-dependent oxidoreductase [Rhodococcus sp. B10]NIL78334.1 dTDP-6-deoxy-L-talose 4-dehydrogenase (NAD(P)(+)) [Rhodococcus sp. B10]